jgi:hypothetical protein
VMSIFAGAHTREEENGVSEKHHHNLNTESHSGQRKQYQDSINIQADRSAQFSRKRRRAGLGYGNTYIADMLRTLRTLRNGCFGASCLRVVPALTPALYKFLSRCYSWSLYTLRIDYRRTIAMPMQQGRRMQMRPGRASGCACSVKRQAIHITAGKTVGGGQSCIRAWARGL